MKNTTRKLRRLSKSVSRKQPQSKNRQKSKRKLARCYLKMRNQRLDFLHKLTTRLAKNHSQICIEDLSVKGLARGHFSKSVVDAGLYEFRRQLSYKSLFYGSTLTVRDRFFPSSKRCSACGFTRSELPLSVREWDCSNCGTHHDRDENAAKNLLIGENLPVGDGNVKPVEIESLTIRKRIVKLRSMKQEPDAVCQLTR